MSNILIKTNSIRAHRKCTCGSKKKYRNCCGKTVSFHDLPLETQKLVRETQAKYQVSTSYHKEYFGYTPEIKSCVFNKKRTVVLGSSLVTSDNLDHDWESPTQFLSSHLKTTLGNDWFENELLKPENEQHIIIRWCREGNEQIIASNQSDESYQLNGSALAYLHLAYDLFVLHDQ